SIWNGLACSRKRLACCLAVTNNCCAAGSVAPCSGEKLQRNRAVVSANFLMADHMVALGNPANTTSGKRRLRPQLARNRLSYNATPCQVLFSHTTTRTHE